MSNCLLFYKYPTDCISAFIVSRWCQNIVSRYSCHHTSGELQISPCNFTPSLLPLSNSRHHKKLTFLRFHKGFSAKVNSGKFKLFLKKGRIRAKPKHSPKCPGSLIFLKFSAVNFCSEPFMKSQKCQFFVMS